MLGDLAQLLLDLNHSLGYFGIFILMTVESSFVPFPSELVVPPAAYLASKGEMCVFLVVLFGILGSLLGASINYFLARWLGRPIIYSLAERRWAKFLLINKRKIEKSESYFLEYGGISTFLGRLFPAVRQLISLPAGFVKMNYWRFLFFTFLGAGFWVVILALLGYYFGENEKLLKDYALEISIALVVLVLFIVIGIYLWKRRRKKLRERIGDVIS